MGTYGSFELLPNWNFGPNATMPGSGATPRKRVSVWKTEIMLSNRDWIRALRLGQFNLGILGLFLDGPNANLGEMNFREAGAGASKNTVPSQVCWLGPRLPQIQVSGVGRLKKRLKWF
jgi:hypothetical protein